MSDVYLTEPQARVRVPAAMTYAIFSIGSRQLRAEPGVTLKLPKLEAEPGSNVTFDHVLLASDGNHGRAGKPTVKGERGPDQVVRHGNGPKSRSYRLARRNGYR